MARILILIGAHICTALRPQKEAEILASVGHDVTVVGTWYDDRFVEQDRMLMQEKKWQYHPAIDFRRKNVVQNLKTRGESFVAKSLFRQFGIVMPELLGYGARELLKTAQCVKADLTIVHSEAGLWAGRELIKGKYNVGVDFEDWFSEQAPCCERNRHPVSKLQSLERDLLNNCKYCITTSQSLSEALANNYHCAKPKVVYNVFPFSEREHLDGKVLDRANKNYYSVCWFSQTIGPNRGLEILLKSLEYCQTRFEIHLRGNCDEKYRDYLKSFIPAGWQDLAFIHPRVPHSQLLSRVAEHDIGLSMESPDIPNRNMTITNKIFQYLQAGLAIVATKTVGNEEVRSNLPEVFEIINGYNVREIARAIDSFVINPKRLRLAKETAFKAARDKYNWERQSSVIIQEVQKALS